MILLRINRIINKNISSIIFILLLWCLSCSNQPSQIELSGFTMGTTYNIKIIPEKDSILSTKLIKQNIDSLIVVDGEEDLLALPSILFAPINTHVLYGQPNAGLVIVSVTESLKVKVYDILIEMGFDENILKY